MKSRTPSLNPDNGSTGSLRTVAVSADREVAEYDGGAVLEVDPAGGSTTITLPGAGIGPGFFLEVVLSGTGTVVFAAGAGTSIVSTVGATPSITTQFTGASVRKRASGDWIVNGAIV